MSEKTKKWVRAAGVRAIKTVAQSAIGCIGAATALGGVDCGPACTLPAATSDRRSYSGLRYFGISRFAFPGDFPRFPILFPLPAHRRRASAPRPCVRFV